MSPSRDETWNLEEGLGRLRWTDRLEDACSLFGSSAQRLPGRDYIHPDTGRRIVVGERLRVERFIELAPGQFVDASIGFGEDGVEDLFLGAALPGEDAARDALADGLSQLFERLGLEAPEPAEDEDEAGESEQHWDVPGLEIELTFDPDRFELIFSRAEDALG